MEVQINSSLIRFEREKRAWSQFHLASVSGLGVRTVQRIESSGRASYESAAAIAAVLSIKVEDILASSSVQMPQLDRPGASGMVQTSVPIPWAPRTVATAAVAVAAVIAATAVLYTNVRDSMVSIVPQPGMVGAEAPGAPRTVDSAVAQPSGWGGSVTRAISDLARLTSVEESRGVLLLEGESRTSRDIASIMRVIHEQDLGAPVVEGIEIRDIGARFVITIYPPDSNGRL